MIIDSPIISGSFLVTGSATVTGSLSVSQGITGSLFGTSSWAVSSSRAVSSSYALTASYAMNGGGGAAFPYTGSANITGSLNLVGPNTITLNNEDYTNTGGAGSHIAFTNPNIYGQNVLSSYINNSLVAKWRTDYEGNVNWVANTGYHAFWTGGDYPAGTIKMYIDSNGDVGIGTTTPTVKLQVVDGTGSMGFPYEAAVFERNGDTKVGVFTSVNDFGNGGASIILGYTNVVNDNSKYPGFEFQYIGGPATQDNYVRYNYIERNSGGTVIAANIDLLNIYADGRVVLNSIGGTSLLGIGVSSPTTTLHVYNANSATVAHFEGVNGSPIKIVTANTSMTVGYAAPIGSIGNGGGQLCVKTGSADVDWAPIVYEKGPMPEKTFPGIDLSSTGPYYITFPGIYEVTTATGDRMYFPDPATLEGQRITVVNTDGSNNITITSDSYAPYLMGEASQMSTLDSLKMYQFVSIGGKWRGMRG